MSDIFVSFNSAAREKLARVAAFDVVAVRDVFDFFVAVRFSTERVGVVVRATVVMRFVVAGSAERCLTVWAV